MFEEELVLLGNLPKQCANDIYQTEILARSIHFPKIYIASHTCYHREWKMFYLLELKNKNQVVIGKYALMLFFPMIVNFFQML